MTGSSGLPSLQEGPIAVLGIGNPIRGDDGAGPEVVRLLADREPLTLLINAESTPENYVGVLARRRPRWVILVDAVDLGLVEGAWRLVARSDLAEMPVATHHLSLGMLMDEIAARTGAITLLLGIQPASLKLGAELSPPVRRSIEEIVSWMDACWSSRGTAT